MKCKFLPAIVATAFCMDLAAVELDTTRSVVRESDTLEARAVFGEADHGDLYVAAKIGGRLFFLGSDKRFHPDEPVPFQENAELEGELTLLQLPVAMIASGRYPLYAVVTDPDADVYDTSSWHSGLARLQFIINEPPEKSGDLDEDGWPDSDADHDGFYDDDDDRDGYHDGDSDHDGYYDDDEDRDGIPDGDETSSNGDDMEDSEDTEDSVGDHGKDDEDGKSEEEADDTHSDDGDDPSSGDSSDDTGSGDSGSGDDDGASDDSEDHDTSGDMKDEAGDHDDSSDDNDESDDRDTR